MSSILDAKLLGVDLTPIDKAIREIIDKQNELKDLFLKTFFAMQIEPDMRDEALRSVFNTMALYEQRDGLTTKWFLGAKPGVKI